MHRYTIERVMRNERFFKFQSRTSNRKDAARDVNRQVNLWVDFADEDEDNEGIECHTFTNKDQELMMIMEDGDEIDIKGWNVTYDDI